VRWHDGARFTAIDAKYSLDRTFDPSVKAARLLPLLQTIERTETRGSPSSAYSSRRAEAARAAADRPNGRHGLPASLEHL
jgi:ABC-type transport system substrate-binding protein